MQLPIQLSLRKITTGIGVIVFVGALVIGATGAFFSDTETSTGNTFSAGAIDLKIDNTSYVTNADGVLEASPENSWQLSDLTDQLFFSFDDVKPGDIGEDTISVHAGSNNAWACMAADLTATPDNGITEPEGDDGDVTDGPTGGELQNFLNFAFWNDDGDNVLEIGETLITPLTGPASTIFDGKWRPIADSSLGTSSAIIGDSTRFIGKAWCFGTLTPAPLANNASTSPLARGTGFTCNGAAVNNVAQTDGISVDVSFQAVQTRSNGQFLCSSLPDFNGSSTTGTTTSLTIIKNVVNAPGGATTSSAFLIHVASSTEVAGSPQPGSSVGTVYNNLTPGVYTIGEGSTKGASTTFSGACTTGNGTATTTATVVAGTNVTCTITNSYAPQGPPGPTVGANLNSFVDPIGCNVTVDDSGGANFTSIQSAINDAGTTAGEKVCVADGTYNEDVNINKSILLVGSGATSTTIINGVLGAQTGAVQIAADNVTVSGFAINAAANSVAALRIVGPRSGATVSFNKITAATGGSSVDTAGGQSNHTFSNNEFVGSASQPIVYVNGTASVNDDSINVDFTQNTFSGAGTEALGNEASSSAITLNKFSATTGFTDVEAWADGITVNQNNFNDAINPDVIHSENGFTGDTGTTDAENNWWGDNNPADGDAGADVDFTPFAGVAFPQN